MTDEEFDSDLKLAAAGKFDEVFADFATTRFTPATLEEFSASDT